MRAVIQPTAASLLALLLAWPPPAAARGRWRGYYWRPARPLAVTSPLPLDSRLAEETSPELLTLPALGAAFPEAPQAGNPSPYVAPGLLVRIVIRTGAHRLYLFDRKGKLTRCFPVGLGRRGMETEAGVKRIMVKVADPREDGLKFWHSAGAFGKRMLKLSDYDLATGEEVKNPYEIHGTYERRSVGRNFSHGCVRLYNEDIEQVYNAVDVGDFVWVQQ